MPRGRKPTPTAILKARGSRWLDRRAGEHQPPPGDPLKPAWLTGPAGEIWDTSAPGLMAAGLLTSLDGVAFGRYCQYLTMWVDALSVIKEKGYTMGRLVPEPQRAIQIDRPEIKRMFWIEERLRKLESKFGLSPGDRAHLALAGGAESADEDDRFFEPRVINGGKKDSPA